MMDHAKTISERCGQKTCSCSCSHQSKLRQIQTDTAGRSSFSNHNINGIIFHCRIQHFLHLPVQSMDLIHKKNISLLQVIEDRRHLTRLLNSRTAGHLQMCPHLIGNNACQRGLTKSGRSIEQHVIQCFSSGFCRLNINLQIIFCFFLTDILVQTLWSKTSFNPDILFRLFCRYDSAAAHIVLLFLFHSFINHAKSYL